MTKKELIVEVSEKAEISKKDAEKAVNAVFETISGELAAGNSVQLTGFGSFEVRERKEKTCINPQTKEKMTIPATKTPAFKPGKQLKDSVVK